MAKTEFELVMSDRLGYKLEEQDGYKLTYKKNAKYSTLVLVIDLGLKYIDPILVPKSVIIYEKDITLMLKEFYIMRDDAKLISQMSNDTFKVLN